MSGRLVGLAFEAEDLSPTQKLVLVALADNAADPGGVCWPSKKTIERKTGLSRATVYRSLDTLIEKGYVREGTDKQGREFFRVLQSQGETDENDAASQPETGNSHGETAQSQGETLLSQGETPIDREPSKEPSGEPSKEPSGAAAGSSPKTKAGQVWAHYAETMNPRRKEPGDDDLKIIKQALRYGEVEELKKAITACGRSDWHMKRGKHKNRRGARHNSIGKILKPRPTKGETWRSRLDFWLDQEPEEGGGEARYTRR